MNIVDIIILVCIVLGALTGFIRGFFKQTVIFVGTILVVVLSFILKNPLSMVLYENLPFFEMGGLTTLNILLYEILAFLICIAILGIVLGIVIKLTGIIEMILKLTVLLALPSKLLGMVVGIIQSIVILYVALFVASMPVFKMPYIGESKFAEMILTKTPLVSNIANEAVDTFNEIAEFSTKKVNMDNVEETNRSIVEIMLKNDVVTTDSIILLNEKGKISINNLNDLVSKYENKEA